MLLCFDKVYRRMLKSLLQDEKILLYVALAGGIALVLLALVLCCSVVSCVQRARARKTFANNGASANGASSIGGNGGVSSVSNKGYLGSTSLNDQVCTHHI